MNTDSKERRSGMTTLRVKPLSVNAAYRGRRFSTPALAQFKKDISILLPHSRIPPGALRAHYIFGVSSAASDADNLVKAFQDVLSECWGFNDKMIFYMVVEKVKVKKGNEFISFSINELSLQ